MSMDCKCCYNIILNFGAAKTKYIFFTICQKKIDSRRSESFVLLVSLLSNTKMDEGVSVKHEGKNVDIKQEKQENVDSFKYEFDSGSQDSSKSGSGGYQRWAPNLNGVRKSAFTPYKSVQCTALTNLQRGSITYRFLSAMSGYS